MRGNASRMWTRRTLLLLLATAWLLKAEAHALQLSAFDAAEWRDQHEAGVEALLGGRLEEATDFFREAVRIAEESTPRSYQLAESLGLLARTLAAETRYGEAEPLLERSLAMLTDMLGPDDPIVAAERNNLADIHRLQGNHDRAGPLYARSLEALESRLGSHDPDLIQALAGLGEVMNTQGSFEEAAELYARVLATRWRRSESDESEFVLEGLENLAAVLSLSHFRDTEQREAVEKLYRSKVSEMAEATLVAAARLLSVELTTEAENMMRLAVREFSDSRAARAEQGDLYVKTGQLDRALDALEDASRMDGPRLLAPEAEAAQRSAIYARIGFVHVQTGEFDKALEAYGRALELSPNAVEPRLALGALYLARDMAEEARNQYARVASISPGNAAAHHGLAEVSLRQGRYEDAAREAAQALAAEPEHQAALYAEARALVRAGRTEEGERKLAEYRENEADVRGRADGEVQVSAINRSAAAALVDGDGEEALRLLTEGIEAHPDAAVLYFNLGVAQTKLGLGQAAIRTFQSILDRGCCRLGDSFLVHWNLSREYEALGAAEAGLRHRVLFLREYDIALRAALTRQVYR